MTGGEREFEDILVFCYRKQEKVRITFPSIHVCYRSSPIWTRAKGRRKTTISGFGASAMSPQRRSWSFGLMPPPGVSFGSCMVCWRMPTRPSSRPNYSSASTTSFAWRPRGQAPRSPNSYYAICARSVRRFPSGHFTVPRICRTASGLADQMRRLRCATLCTERA